MDTEMKALIDNDTWSLVSFPFGHIIIGNKWVNKPKLNSDGSLSKHKARLVVQGFSQTPGVDFSDTFSPVIKPAVVRVVLLWLCIMDEMLNS